MAESPTIDMNTGTESPKQWALYMGKGADEHTENSESVSNLMSLDLSMFKGADWYDNSGYRRSMSKPGSSSCPPSVRYYTFAVFCKRLFHAGLQDRTEIGLIFANPHETGISFAAYANLSKNCETIVRYSTLKYILEISRLPEEAPDILRQVRTLYSQRFKLTKRNAEESTFSGPEWLPELNIPSGSQILRRRIKSLFAAASDEVFEEGMNSRFSERLASMIEQYGNPAVATSSALSVLPGTNSEVAYETMRLFGRIDHPATYEERMNALIHGLQHSLPRVRDGAALGLASLNDPQAAPALKKAINQERYQELRDDMEQVLEQLE